MIKVLHILEYSLPLVSGYTVRSKYILENSQKLGIKPVVITSPLMQTSSIDLFQSEFVDGVRFYRTGLFNKLNVNDNFLKRIYKRYIYFELYF